MDSSEIKLRVDLDNQKIPEKITWEAVQMGVPLVKEAAAMMLSLWDNNEKATYSIDLWTKEMPVQEMDFHYYQILLKLADTYGRATHNQAVAEKFRSWAEEFRLAVDIIPPGHNH